MNTALYRTRRLSLAMLTTAVVEANDELADAGTGAPYSSALLNLGRSLLHEARHRRGTAAPRQEQATTNLCRRKSSPS